MNEDDKVKIVFTDKKWITEYGISEKPVPAGLAKKYLSLGIAKILETPPAANIQVEKEPTCYSPEWDLLDKVCWIGNNTKEGRLVFEVGKKLGFNIRIIDSLNYDPADIYSSKVIIIENDIPELLMENQKRAIKSIIAQRRKTVIYLYSEGEPSLFWAVKASINFCIDNIPSFGKLCEFILFGNEYEFWRKVSRLCD